MSNEAISVLMDVTIKDKKKFLEYVEGHKPSMQQYGGKLLFRSNDMEAIEGTWSPKLFVVHEWPNERAFREWDASREYEPWKKLRKEAVEMNMILARRMPD
jgi:uncharacterized protein (DUF1330 family)